MNIEGLTPRQKSVMLAKMMGWAVEVFPTGNYEWRGEQYRAYWTGPNGEELSADKVGYSEQEAAEVQMVNFYSVKNFNKAWQVLGWVSDTAGSGRLGGDTSNQWISAIDYLLMDRWRNSTAEEVQAEWLDKTLSLAIEAGLVELQTA